MTRSQLLPVQSQLRLSGCADAASSLQWSRLSVAVAAERMRRHSCSERAGGSFQDPRTYLPFFVLWGAETDSVVE